MLWNIKRGRVYISKQGTAKAHLYYWVRHQGVGHFEAGYYGYGKEITFLDRGEPRRFKTIGEAKAYCERKDNEAIIITAVTA
jgi:hypothetical protein